MTRARISLWLLGALVLCSCVGETVAPSDAGDGGLVDAAPDTDAAPASATWDQSKWDEATWQ